MSESAKVAAQTLEGAILACWLRKATYLSLLALNADDRGLAFRSLRSYEKRRFWHDLEVVPLHISFFGNPLLLGLFGSCVLYAT